jgi:hypothetical protein
MPQLDEQAPSGEFAVTRRGYHPEQVEEYLRYQDARIRMLAADRDAVIEQSGRLARRVDRQYAETRTLRDQVRRLAGPPQRAEGMTQRLHSMLRLALDEVAELRTRAQAEADATVAAARLELSRGEQLRGELAWRLAQLRREREMLAADRGRLDHLMANSGEQADRVIREAVELAEVLVREARVEAHRVRSVAADEVISLHEDGRRRSEVLESEAAAARAAADREAAEGRARADDDFRIAQAARRADAAAELDRDRAAAHAEVARLLAEARSGSARIVERGRQAAAAMMRAGEERHAEANRLLSEARAYAGRACTPSAAGHRSTRRSGPAPGPPC